MTGPEDEWTPPAWLSGPKYTARELMWLCAQLDATARAQRATINQLREQLERAQHREASL